MCYGRRRKTGEETENKRSVETENKSEKRVINKQEKIRKIKKGTKGAIQDERRRQKKREEKDRR